MQEKGWPVDGVGLTNDRHWAPQLHCIPPHLVEEVMAQWGGVDVFPPGFFNSVGQRIVPPTAPSAPPTTPATAAAPPVAQTQQTLASQPLEILCGRDTNGLWSTGWWQGHDGAWHWHVQNEGS